MTYYSLLGTLKQINLETSHLCILKVVIVWIGNIGERFDVLTIISDDGAGTLSAGTKDSLRPTRPHLVVYHDQYSQDSRQDTLTDTQW